MIAITWEFDGGDLDPAAARAAVGKILDYYTQALAGITCPVHEQSPWLKVQGRTITTLAVSIETCCESLLTHTNARLGQVTRRNDE